MPPRRRTGTRTRRDGGGAHLRPGTPRCPGSPSPRRRASRSVRGARRQAGPGRPGWPEARRPPRGRQGRSRTRWRARQHGRRRGRGCASAPPCGPAGHRLPPGRPTCAPRPPRPPNPAGAGGGRPTHTRRRKAAPRSRRRPRATGWQTPTSGFADCTATTAGSPWVSTLADTVSPATRPCRSTAIVSKPPPRPACQAPACRTAECSTLEASSRLPWRARPASSPNTPRWHAWVPLGVNVTSSARTPRHSATTARALSRISRDSRAGRCRRRGSAYARSTAWSRTSRAAGWRGAPEA